MHRGQHRRSQRAAACQSKWIALLCGFQHDPLNASLPRPDGARCDIAYTSACENFFIPAQERIRKPEVEPTRAGAQEPDAMIATRGASKDETNARVQGNPSNTPRK
jgi:hypothetical protein